MAEEGSILSALNELTNATKQRLEAEKAYNEDLSKEQKKATETQIQSAKDSEKSWGKIVDELQAQKSFDIKASGIAEALNDAKSNLVGAAEDSMTSKILTIEMPYQSKLLERVEDNLEAGLKLQKGDTFAEEKEKERLQREEKSQELLKTIAENTEPKKESEAIKKKGSWWGAIFLALAAIAGLAAGFVAGVGASLWKFIKFIGKGILKVGTFVLKGLKVVFKGFLAIFQKIWRSKWIKGIRDFFAKIGTKISSFVKGKWTKWIDDVAGWFKNIGTKIKGVVSGKFQWLDNIAGWFKNIGGKFGKLSKLKFGWLQGILNFFGKIGKFGASTGKAAGGGIITKAAGTIKWIFGLFGKFFGMFGKAGKIGGLVTKVFGFMKPVIDTFKKFFKFGKSFGKVLGPIGLIITIVDGIVGAIKGAISGYKDGGGIAGAIKGAIKGLFNSLVGSIVNLGAKLVGWILGALGFEKLSKSFKSFDIMKYFDPVWKIVESIITFIPGALSSLWSGIKTVGGVAWNIAKGAFDTVKSMIMFWPNVVMTIWEGLKALGSGIGKLAGGIWDTIKTGLVNIVPNIFGLKSWLAGKLGVSVEEAEAAGESRKQKLGYIGDIIKSNILTRMPDVFGLKGWLSEKWGIPLLDAARLTGKTQHMIGNIGEKLKESIASLAFKFFPAWTYGWIADSFGVPKPAEKPEKAKPEKTKPLKAPIAEPPKPEKIEPPIPEELPIPEESGLFDGGELIVNTTPDERIQELNANWAEIMDWKNRWMQQAGINTGSSPIAIDNRTSVSSTNTSQGIITQESAQDSTAKTSMQNGQKGTRP